MLDTLSLAKIGGPVAIDDLSIRPVTNSTDKAAVMRLRDEIYVADQNRLGAVEDMTTTFDRYDDAALYFLATSSGTPIGAVKLIPDSEIGLPCETVVPLDEKRGKRHRLAEVGHLINLPAYRKRGVGIALMRATLVYAVAEFRSTYLVGDFFVDNTAGGRLHPFYTLVGFEELCEPYSDDRFVNSPDSIVGGLEIASAYALRDRSDGRARALLDYFFDDFDVFPRSSYSV